MSLSLRAATFSVALVSLFVLPACGSDAEAPRTPTSAFGRQTAAEIGAAFRSDMASVRSLTVEADVDDRAFHLSLDTDGNCVGWVEQGGGKAEFIETIDGSFVKGEDSFWLGQATTDEQKANVKKALAVWDGRWVRSPRGAGDLSTPSYLVPECDHTFLLPLLTGGDRKLTEVGQEREIDGREAVAVVATQDGTTSTVWIATEAPHRALRLTQSGADAATYDFSNYDEPLDIKTPTPDEVFDLVAANKKAE